MQDITTELQPLLSDTKEITGVTCYLEALGGKIPTNEYTGEITFALYNGQFRTFDYRLALVAGERWSASPLVRLALLLRIAVLQRIESIMSNEQEANHADRISGV